MGASTTEAAFALLGLSTTATLAEVRLAWKRLAMTLHPDRGGDPAEFDRTKRAYELASEIAVQPIVCEVCKGSGKVVHTRGFSQVKFPCPTCGGLGTIRRGDA